MKRSITEILQERFGDPIGKRYAGDAPAGVRSVNEEKCPKCGMEDCDCDHMSEAECGMCGFMEVEGSCGCTHEMNEAKKKKRGLWANIHARRKAGKRPKRPGEKGYPKDLDVARK